MELLGKSTGITLLEHSESVKNLALSMLKYSVSEKMYNQLSNLLGDISLLHDIGKATVSFQEFLLGDRTFKVKFTHNEIGWAFLVKFLSDDYVNKDLLVNSVYWHHGISNKINSSTVDEILDNLDTESITNMVEYLISIVGDDNINEVDEFDINTTKSPFYYSSNDVKILPKLHLLRSVLVTCDRLVSNENNEFTPENIGKYFELTTDFKIDSKYVNERYNSQVEIIKDIGKTTILKAPAGFGKTLVGLQWAIEQGKRILWVTPRNTIAESVYTSLLEEAEALNIKPSIQLILGGEVKRGSSDMYNSDIIVTNIDNYLSPSFNNTLLVNSSLINGATVIFDEFHELITDAPLMGVFVSLMKLRHTISNAKTLLLSATPTSIDFLWNTMSNKTLVLPNKETHYPAVHNKKYKLIVTNKKPVTIKNTNTLVIKNTIRNAQSHMVNGEYAKLLHSHFTDERKSEDLDFLLSKYGKKSKQGIAKPNILGTHILQAALDVSFSNIVEDVLSPESTIQRLGRCNRWGEFENGSITIYKSLKGESDYASNVKVKSILYNRNLSDEWFDYILQYNGQELTLDEFYVIYNSFINKNIAQLNQHIKVSYLKSISEIERIHPVKLPTNNKRDVEKTIIKAGGNKLRSGSKSNEIFFLVLDYNTREWVGPFNEDLFQPFDMRFNEGGGIINKMVSSMKVLRKNNDTRFEYNELIDTKKLTIDEIRRCAKYNVTPYLNYTDVYDDKLGLINESFLKKII